MNLDWTDPKVVGALGFGLVIGWVTYRTLRKTADNAAITDIAAVVTAIGGGTVTKLYGDEGELFACYCIGLTIGFFGYFLSALVVESSSFAAKTSESFRATWMMRRTKPEEDGSALADE